MIEFHSLKEKYSNNSTACMGKISKMNGNALITLVVPFSAKINSGN